MSRRRRSAFPHRQGRRIRRNRYRPPTRTSDPDATSSVLGIHLGAVLVLSVLWCIAHREVLSGERELDPHVERTPDEWGRIRAAVREGRVGDIPLPVETARAWCTGEGLDETELRACLEHKVDVLPLVARAVECLWGHASEELPPVFLLAALAIARIRRARIEADYRPPEGERKNIYYEVHQAARGPEAMERSRMVWRLNTLFKRFGDLDPAALACVHLDHAAETESQGHHDKTPEHLEEVRRLLGGRDDLDQCEYGEVCLAHHVWATGEPSRALAMLADLTSQQACDLRRRIESREEEREALRHAERLHRRRTDLESWCAVAHAHMAAKHTIAGERIASDICRDHPTSPLAWETKALVLHRIGRHRDAATPARMALCFGGDESSVKGLLAKILSRIGPEGRQEAVESAEDAIDGLVRRMDSSSAELSDLADVVHLGGAIEFARTADGYVWRNRHEQEPPPEWLGAAVARRCHDDWSEDAAAWLVRLGEAAPLEPVELARFVTDRVDHLQFLRGEVAKWVFGNRKRLPEERSLRSAASEVFACRHGHSLRMEGHRIAALAAQSLGVAPCLSKDALSLTSEDVGALKDLARAQPEPNLQFRGRMTGWSGHRAAIQAAWGTELLIRLRASEAAQRTLITLPGLGDRATTAAFSVLETLFCEQLTWVRWGAEQSIKSDVEETDSRLSPGTRDRLQRLMKMAALDDDGISRAVWRTKWHHREEE